MEIKKVLFTAAIAIVAVAAIYRIGPAKNIVFPSA